MFPDIYFEKNYGLLCSYLEKGEVKQIFFENQEGKISYLFILREIPIQIEGKTYFDIISPYGYGGPLVLEVKGNREKLVRDFEGYFTNYCKEQKIVSEFVRFHPLVKNYKDFQDLYQSSFLRYTIATNLTVDDPFQEEFSKSARKTTRRALREGVEVRLTEDPNSLEEFVQVYYDTMDRNEASDFYYFDKEYFQKLKELLDGHYALIYVYKDEVCISAGLYFHYGDYAHAHLSGTKEEYLSLSPAYILKYYSCQWAKGKGCKWIHYGGGTTNQEDDGLLLFKKKFTKEEPFHFYVGRKIYDQEIYDALVHLHPGENPDYFPRYRG